MPKPNLTFPTGLVLQAISQGNRHGFDIIDATGLPSGTVYPALRRLEGAECLTSQWEAEEEAEEKACGSGGASLTGSGSGSGTGFGTGFGTGAGVIRDRAPPIWRPRSGASRRRARCSRLLNWYTSEP